MTKKLYAAVRNKIYKIDDGHGEVIKEIDREISSLFIDGENLFYVKETEQPIGTYLVFDLLNDKEPCAVVKPSSWNPTFATHNRKGVVGALFSDSRKKVGFGPCFYERSASYGHVVNIFMSPAERPIWFDKDCKPVNAGTNDITSIASHDETLYFLYKEKILSKYGVLNTIYKIYKFDTIKDELEEIVERSSDKNFIWGYSGGFAFRDIKIGVNEGKLYDAVSYSDLYDEFAFLQYPITDLLIQKFGEERARKNLLKLPHKRNERDCQLEIPFNAFSRLHFPENQSVTPSAHRPHGIRPNCGYTLIFETENDKKGENPVDVAFGKISCLCSHNSELYYGTSFGVFRLGSIELFSDLGEVTSLVSY